MGAAALLPTTLALISHAVPDPRKRGTFVGLWAILLAALAIGPMWSPGDPRPRRLAVDLPAVPYRWPCSPSASRHGCCPIPARRGTRRLDWPGQITAAWRSPRSSTESSRAGPAPSPKSGWSWPSPAAVCGVAFVLAERRSAIRCSTSSLFRSPGVQRHHTVAMITFLGLIGFFFVLSLYFGMVQRLDTLGSPADAPDLRGRLVVAGWRARDAQDPATRHDHTGLLVATAALLP